MKSELKIVVYRDFDFTKVRFYTVKFEDEDQTELDKFFDKYQTDYSNSIFYIKMWLAEIGEKYGAEPRFFRPEDSVEALPPKGPALECIDFETTEEDLKLRLYCIVLSTEVVILVNGGLKESQLTQDSPTCWSEYLKTVNIASQINRMERQRQFEVRGKMLKRGKQFELNYEKN